MHQFGNILTYGMEFIEKLFLLMLYFSHFIQAFCVHRIVPYRR